MNQELQSEYLRQIRGDISQEVVAGYIGVTQEGYGLYERGKRKISLEKLLVLVERLNAPKEGFIKLLFPSIEQVVLTGAKSDQVVMQRTDFERAATSLGELDSIFSLYADSEKGTASGRAKGSVGSIGLQGSLKGRGGRRGKSSGSGKTHKSR